MPLSYQAAVGEDLCNKAYTTQKRINLAMQKVYLIRKLNKYSEIACIFQKKITLLKDCIKNENKKNTTKAW
ncbi:hypothetical protein PWG14_04475 (plasmid) [Chromobacterium amazonense]|uniref:hypothetical protein n=1 Tax=Chromobacterium amazonense TaxID=1382803 RepID=UPI00237D71FD|nr:hypothetical protein [Chromobacterium amazonense]MDE1712019.1 hypothetical protein [Chromobacterium amazonense]